MDKDLLDCFSYAILQGDSKLFDLLAKDFDKFDQKDKTSLLENTIIGAPNTSFIQHVLDYGYDINYKNEEFGVENVNEALDKLYSDMTIDLEEVYTFEQAYGDRLTLRSYTYTLNKGNYYLFVAGTVNVDTGMLTAKTPHDVQSTSGTISELGNGVYRLNIDVDNTVITINYNSYQWLGVGQYVYYAFYK